MKKIVFIASLILAIGFSIYAQDNNFSCPKIKISAPELVEERNGSFKVSASFENEKAPSNTKFNWIIIKDNEVLRKFGEAIIEVDTDGTEKQNRVTIIAENQDTKCRDLVFANVLIIPVVGSPLILDEYSELSWNEEKFRLENLISEMKKRENSELLAWVYFDVKTIKSKAKNRLTKVAGYLSEHGLAKNRITFLLCKDKTESYRYQSVPQELLDVIYSEDCILIRGEDLREISALFR